MTTSARPFISLVVPVFNEAQGLRHFNSQLHTALKTLSLKRYELIYCDDGSTDGTYEQLLSIRKERGSVKIVRLSRNFGKEAALLAGIATASGAAIITLDGDGQHPVDKLREFIEAWEQGARVVIGVRTANNTENRFKQLASRMYYRLFNSIAKQELIPGSTDYRLIDASIKNALLRMNESNGMTRTLIDWLGFERAFIYFESPSRLAGNATYDRRKRLSLATNNIISHSPTPLFMFGYIGAAITILSFCLGVIVFVEEIILNDPLAWKVTGTAMLSILVIFLVGLILLSQFMISLYVAHVSVQSRQRPLYVIDYRKSAGIIKDS